MRLPYECPHMQALSLSHRRVSIIDGATVSARRFYSESVVFGNSMRRNVLQRPLGSVAPRLRGAYLFEVDPRLSSNVPGREHRNSR